MNTISPENLHQDIGRSIQYFRMFLEGLCRIDKPLQFDELLYSSKTTQLVAQHQQQFQRNFSCKALTILYVELGSYFSSDRCSHRLSGEEHQITPASRIPIVRSGGTCRQAATNKIIKFLVCTHTL